MFKLITKILLSFVLAFTLSIYNSQRIIGDTLSKQSDNIYIFYTGDVHCGVEENLGYPAVKALIQHEKETHPFVTLVDTGDYIQGGTLGSLTKGTAIIDIMNAMQYDIATIGNHEFDYGMEQLGSLLDQARFDIIASNVKYTGSKTNIFEGRAKEYIIKDYGNTKVAFLGILTPSSITDSTPTFFMEDDKFVYDFYSGQDGKELANRVQSLVDKARADGADYVIALSHLGSSAENVPFGSIALIHNTSGIDVFIDGHSHSVIVGTPYPNKDGKDVILTSTGTKLQNVGELIIEPNGKISTSLISEYNQKDESIQKKIDEANKTLETLLSEHITDLSFDLPITNQDGYRIVRSREVPLANLVADSIRHAMQTDVTIVNGGGIRATIPQGEVTLKELFNVLPFQNELGSCKASGQQILDALEFGASKTEALTVVDENPAGENGAFLQVSGLKYTIDTSIPSGVVLDDNNMMKEIVGERRVKDVQVLQDDGTYVPIDPNAMYTVSSVSYVLFRNGDGNTAFNGSTSIIENGPMDLDVFKQYILDSNGISDQYKAPEGRITVK